MDPDHSLQSERSIPVFAHAVRVRDRHSRGYEWLLAKSRKDIQDIASQLRRRKGVDVIGPAPILDWSVIHPLLALNTGGRAGTVRA